MTLTRCIKLLASFCTVYGGMMLLNLIGACKTAIGSPCHLSRFKGVKPERSSLKILFHIQRFGVLQEKERKNNKEDEDLRLHAIDQDGHDFQN